MLYYILNGISKSFIWKNLSCQIEMYAKQKIVVYKKFWIHGILNESSSK